MPIGALEGAGRSLVGHSDRVHDVAFSRDGERLASAGLDSTAQIWNPGSASMSSNNTLDWVEAGCQLVNRNLSIAEWDELAAGIPYERTCPGHLRPHPGRATALVRPGRRLPGPAGDPAGKPRGAAGLPAGPGRADPGRRRPVARRGDPVRGAARRPAGPPGRGARRARHRRPRRRPVRRRRGRHPQHRPRALGIGLRHLGTRAEAVQVLFTPDLAPLLSRLPHLLTFVDERSRRRSARWAPDAGVMWRCVSTAGVPTSRTPGRRRCGPPPGGPAWSVEVMWVAGAVVRRRRSRRVRG